MSRPNEADQVDLAVVLHGLTPSWTLYCPRCAHPLADVFQNRVRARQGRIWLQTTEDQPELSEQLRTWDARGLELTTRLDWGQCPSCSAGFSLIALHLYLHEETRTLTTTASEPLHLARACHERMPSGWLAAQVCTPLESVHEHVFGPIQSEADLSIWMETTLRPLWTDLLTLSQHPRLWPDGCLAPSSTRSFPAEHPTLDHDPLF